MREKDFGYLGLPFQISLVKAIIEDHRFGTDIIGVLDASYFDNASLKYIITNIKELHEKFNQISDYERLRQKIMADSINEDITRVHLDTLQAVEESSDEIDRYVAETAMNFCKQQNIKKELKKVQSIIDNGEFEEYNKIEEIITKALQVGSSEFQTTSIFENVDDSLTDECRKPITTGINGFDTLLKGGLGRGELGVILAPMGVGKSTILTKFANAAYNDGHNVLHIFFEDNLVNIRRKHYTIWSGIVPDEQPRMKEYVKEKIEEYTKNSKGDLQLLKLPSHGVTVTEIKNRIRKMISRGFKPDLVVIDYVDCIASEKATGGDEWKGEGTIMRQLDAMSVEFNIAIWVATQGNRASVTSEIVQGDQVGGSIQKLQVAHVVISIAKTLEQKENNIATITFIKSRLGKDGVIFQNCKFWNERMLFDTESVQTLVSVKQEQEEEKARRATAGYERIQQLRGEIGINR